MKLSRLIAFMITFAGVMAFGIANAAPGAGSKPLLSKVVTPGFVAPGHQVGTACDVYPDHIVITTSLYGAGIQTKEVKAAKTNLNQLNELLKKASLGHIDEKSGPVDGPTTVLSANFVSDTGVVVNVLLSENNGGNGRVRKNISNEADILTFTLNQLCR
jgi:hypothetical protein